MTCNKLKKEMYSMAKKEIYEKRIEKKRNLYKNKKEKINDSVTSQGECTCGC